jgi:hypothetical protein
MDNQHLARWQGLKSTQIQAQELISGPSPTAKTKLLSFNKTQSSVVTSLLTTLDNNKNMYTTTTGWHSFMLQGKALEIHTCTYNKPCNCFWHSHWTAVFHSMQAVFIRTVKLSVFFWLLITLHNGDAVILSTVSVKTTYLYKELWIPTKYVYMLIWCVVHFHYLLLHCWIRQTVGQ